MSRLLTCYTARYPGTYIQEARRQTPVYWGHWSIVQAELNCLEVRSVAVDINGTFLQDLLNNGRRWKYALNLAGSETSILTNQQLGSSLQQSKYYSTFFYYYSNQINIFMATRSSLNFKTVPNQFYHQLELV